MSLLERSAPTSTAPARHSPDGYFPFPLSRDARAFGLTTSAMRLGSGTVSVRHGRRTDSDTATILLHGAAGSWTTWTPLLAAADSANPAHPASAALTDLIIPDLPGWGDSALPAGVSATGESATIESTAAAVAEVARALGYRSWTVIGHSLGGFVALELAASEPRSTSFVGLVSPASFSVIETVRHPVSSAAVLPGFGALLPVMRGLARLGRAGSDPVGALHRRGLLRPLAAPLFRHPGRVPESVIDALATELRPNAFAAASARAGRYDASIWSRIECPVRASQGDADVFVGETDADRLRAVIRDFSLCTEPDTGHFGHMERPFQTLAHVFTSHRD
ncbi:alpha/beta hydrolase [Cryobacterium sp. TmT2-59]|uniref:alpha/beta fold hydrolase n=1 Tax=Cryobacterium sp. TmT2-59 TaxID=1259264 RepID=UPI00106BD103|nr:alpha/beta hydrolase [Cryobacterium sp. TmT2-59]TFC83172.1 alpha/beta hydrolase [Cryobacterium sp. TmT2-59]